MKELRAITVMVILLTAISISSGYSFQASPDLVVLSVIPFTDHPSFNLTLSVDVTIKNEGSVAAGSFYVDLFNGTQPLFISRSVSGLDPGETRVLDLTAFGPSVPGHWDLTAKVDSYDDIFEINEFNNQYPATPIDIAWITAPNAAVYPWPVFNGDVQPRVSGLFGENRISHYHKGIDIPGTALAVYSVSSGEITSIGAQSLIIGGHYYLHITNIPTEFQLNYWVEDEGVLLGYTNSENHVHLEDIYVGDQRNPLYHIEPFYDGLPPTINSVSIYESTSNYVVGYANIIVNAEDGIAGLGKGFDINIYKIGYSILDPTTNVTVYGPIFNLEFEDASDFNDLLIAYVYAAGSTKSNFNYIVTNTPFSNQAWNSTTVNDGFWKIRAFAKDIQVNATFKDLIIFVDNVHFNFDEPVLEPYTMEEEYYSAAATIQMALSSLGYEETQVDIQFEGNGGSDGDLSNEEVLTALQAFLWPTDPNNPYHYYEDSYNDKTTALGIICKWVCFDISTVRTIPPGQSVYAPAFIPLDGGFESWVAVTGIETSDDPWEESSFIVHGLWYWEPDNTSGSGGGETFVEAASFSRYSAIGGWWPVVYEPDEALLGLTTEELIGTPRIIEPKPVTIDSTESLAEVALNHVINHPQLSKKEKLKSVLEANRNAGEAVFVKNTDTDDSYYLVPVNIGNVTHFSIIVDGEGYYLEEVNIPTSPVVNFLMSKGKAIETLKEKNLVAWSKNPHAELVFDSKQTNSHFNPVWKVTDGAKTFFVKNDGRVNAPGLASKTSADVRIPTSHELFDNYPNPFNPVTTIRYAVKEQSRVIIRIYNTQGQEVRTLVDGNMQAGTHQVVWDSRNNSGIQVGGGIYFYRLTAGNVTITKKMLLLK